MRHVNYSDKKDHAGTATHRAVDDAISPRDNGELQEQYEEGFASASGVSNETAESGGRIRHPEAQDKARPDGVPAQLEDENAGLADD
ncbi:MAG: hypothetical protein WDN72_07650 [Alphaproteobacteria bacterium]